MLSAISHKIDWHSFLSLKRIAKCLLPPLPARRVSWWVGHNYYLIGMGACFFNFYGIIKLWLACCRITLAVSIIFQAFFSNWAFANGMFVTKSTLLHCTIHVLKSLYLIHICILMSPEMHSQNRTVPYLLNILSFRIFAFSVLIGMA